MRGRSSSGLRQPRAARPRAARPALVGLLDRNGPISVRRSVTQWPPSASAIERTYVPEPTRRSRRDDAVLVARAARARGRASRASASRPRRPAGGAGRRARRRSSRPTPPGSAARPRRGALRAPRSSSPRGRRVVLVDDSPSGSPVVVRAREVDLRQVALVELHEAILEARRAPREQHEQAGRERVERPRVTRLRARCAPRTRATIANDDGPAGLSTRTTPVGSSAFGMAISRRGAVRRRRTRRTIRRVISSIARSVENPAARLWPPPPKLRAIADTSTPSGCERSEPLRAAAAPRRELADERDELGAVDRAQVVDDALRVRLLRPGRLEVLAAELGDDDPAVGELRRVLERAGEQLQLRERRRLVDLDEHLADVRARLDELGGEPQRLGRRVRVLEAPRVGDDRRVERLGDLGRQSTPSPAKTSPAPRPSTTRPRRRGSTSPKRVLSWWWSMFTVSGAASTQRRLDDPALLRAVDGDEHALGEVGRRARAGGRAPRGRGTRTRRAAAPARRAPSPSPCRATRARGASRAASRARRRRGCRAR